MTGSDEKASRYASLLENARVNGSWSELPELVRKVNKHAPQRKVLIHTATAEHDVATSTATASNRPSLNSLTVLSSTLQSEGTKASEDVFQGKTCLLWARWIGLEGNPTTAGFDTAAAVRELGGQNLSTWTRICIVKSAYIEGTNYMQNGRPREAQKVFSVAIANLQTSRDLVLSTPQLAYWAEQLLAQLAIGSSQHRGSETMDSEAMDALRYWAAIVSKTREAPASTYRNSTSHIARLFVWERYYGYLSAQLRKASIRSSGADTTTRLQQSTELRKVERAYENELLRTKKFPKATENNASVEHWVEQAVQNWQILCGPHWRDTELGEGGRDAIARNMLDILYRAATKTFHSTLILRRLFQVHKSLSEFGLAYRAFDTYIELVDRSRVRAVKLKKPEAGHESDEIVLTTVSEAVIGLCDFGRQVEARKAFELCLKLEDWLEKIGVEAGDQDQVNTAIQNGHVEPEQSRGEIGSDVLQVVYRAIGVGKSQWARWTPVGENRSGLQEDALSDFRKACSHGTPDIETLYVTSLLLAETRDIPAAIACAKQALTKSQAVNSGTLTRASERRLVSVWHLLALLLSSRQDFENAAKSCVAAFEQFIPADVALKSGLSSSVMSSTIEKQSNSAVVDVAEDLECHNIQEIIEVRITELALTELTDGPEEAVNSSNELLSLFSRLFAHLKVPIDTPSVTRTLVPPKTSAGTIKSTRHSLFGRKRHSDVPQNVNEDSQDVASVDTTTTRPSTHATQAPTIHVTNEDEKASRKGHRLRDSLDSSHSKTSADRSSRRLSFRRSQHGQLDGAIAASDQAQISQDLHVSTLQTVPDDKELPNPTIPLDHALSTDSRQELPAVGHNLGSHDNIPLPMSHNEQPPQQDTRLPTLGLFTNATTPPPRFSKTASQKQALLVLAKIWLVIATLYRRAKMFEDSREACEEAGKAVSKIEALVGAVDQSARALADAGWGAGTKSVDEAWADVYSERAELWLAIYQHRTYEDKTTNKSNEELRAAVEQYEQCLMFVPNHPSGVIGLSNLLLDFYEKKVDLGRRVNDGANRLTEQDRNPDNPSTKNSPVPPIIVTTPSTDHLSSSTDLDSDRDRSREHPQPPTKSTTPTHTNSSRPDADDLRKTPENLNRIAARDRAYGLLSSLTKLGSGWDNSEAWYALARAHELGGEIEKAKSILWWCIELEDTKPIRHWRNLGVGV